VRVCDLSQADQVAALFQEIQPEVVIHCAAIATLDDCENDPELAMRVNADLPGWLAGEAARSGTRLIHLSTDAVFDGQSRDYSEDDRPNPLSVYARTKLAGESKVLEANPGAFVARVNFFGWSMGGRRSLAELFYYTLAAGKPMFGFTDVYFCPLLVNHLANLLLEIAATDLSGLYHVFSPECLSKYAFGLSVARKFGLDEKLVQPVPVAQAGFKAARSPNLIMRSDKLNRALGRSLPTQAQAMQDFYQLWVEGHPQRLRQMGAGVATSQ
jgi:dTDP-4-dehydrorhamnose reductase